jgi:ABC-type multidrug transport system fused ATPase/permease subunit
VLLHPKPRILLFDEATANIDAQTDELVQSLIASAFPRVTKIVIAHRLQTVMSCDRVMVMDKGEIVEFDKPSTLLERNGLFK